jgi:hypothetical protein
MDNLCIMNRGKSCVGRNTPWLMLPPGGVEVLLGMVVLVAVVVQLTVVVMAGTHTVVVSTINNQRLNANCVGEKDTLPKGAGNASIEALLVKRRSVAVASYDVDTNWYADSGTTDHITSDLKKLTAQDKYLGNDEVHTASGSGMKIDQIGHTVIHTPSRNLSLNNILYVPESSKYLISVHLFTRENHIFIKVHPWYFLIKDRATKRVLHHGKVERGLYPLKSIEKQVLAVTTPSQSRWPCRLGHPSLQIMQ